VESFSPSLVVQLDKAV